MTELENLNPNIYNKCEERIVGNTDRDDHVVDEFDAREIFGEYFYIKHILIFFTLFFILLDLIRNINDPEHPLTLEELHVLQLNQVTLNNNDVTILFTPTIPHCSMATLIGVLFFLSSKIIKY